jgi:O-antigen/teichoic acid export membrane protein
VSAPVRKEGRVARAMFNYGLGGYLPQIIGFFLTPLFTHYIPVEQQGWLEICNYSQLLLIFVMRLGMPGALVRYYFELKDGPEFRDLVTTVAWAVLAFSALLAAVAMVALAPLFARAWPELPYHPWMTLSIGVAFLHAAPDIQRRLYAAREQSAASARLSVLNALVLIVATVVCVIPLGMGAWGTLVAQAFAALVFFGVALVNNRKDLAGRFSGFQLRRALAYGLPLVPHHASAWAQQFVGRLILGVVSTVQVGWLSIAAKVASPIAIATGAFTNAYQPIYFSWRTEHDVPTALAETRRVARAIVALGAVAVIGAATLGATAVRFLVSREYVPAAELVGPAAFAVFLHLIYTVITQELFFQKDTRRASRIFLLASLCNVVVCVPLALELGALGAILAQVVGSAVSILLTFGITRATFPSPVTGRVAVPAVGAAALACVLEWLLAPDSRVGRILLTSAIFVVCSAIAMIATGALRQLRIDVKVFMSARRARRGKGNKRAAAEDPPEPEEVV